ncbi:MAG: IS4 family transposase [Thermoflexales bacterium]
MAREFLNLPSTVERFRCQATEFIRERRLTFFRVSMTMLRGHKMSQQNGLNQVFQDLGMPTKSPTASAICQARRKVKPELFDALNRVICDGFYAIEDPDQPIKYWRGRRLLAVDGSILHMPDTPETRQAFGAQHNQHGDYVLAQTMVLHDVCNDLGLAASLQAIQNEQDWIENESLWSTTKSGDVLMLDRGLVGYPTIAKAKKTRRDVIMRCPSAGFGVVRRFFESPDLEWLTDLEMPAHKPMRDYCRKNGLPKKIPVRLIKFQLSSGETEVLLTTLCDQEQYPRAAIYEAYGLRYVRQEGFFNRLKNIFELERFSGSRLQVIRQDFYGILFLTTFESILMKPAQQILDARDLKPETKTIPKVNRTTSYSCLVLRVVSLLSDTTKDIESVLDEITALLLLTPTHHAPNRSNPRLGRQPYRTANYLRYVKRLTP